MKNNNVRPGKSADRAWWENRPSYEIEAEIKRLAYKWRPTVKEGLLHATLLKIIEEREEASEGQGRAGPCGNESL